MDTSLILVSISGVSIIGIAYIFIRLRTILKHAPKLKSLNKAEEKEELPRTSLTVIIPTYNEESKIENCITKVLENTDPCSNWNLIIVDDCSSDKTVEIIMSLKKRLKLPDTKLLVKSAGPRPKGERWVGKNWACSVGIEETKSQWVLFIDADVEITNQTLKRALKQAIDEKCDLLSLAPKLTCNCLSEWMVQPIIAMLLIIGFPISKTNDEHEKVAFAAGPFMLFRESAYTAIGGHRNIAGEVVEDLTLARLIKSSGYKLKFILGLDAVLIRMYSNFASLWEGWSKNWFLGLDRNIVKSTFASLLVFWIFSVPLLIVLINFSYMLSNSNPSQYILLPFIASALALLLQYILRNWLSHRLNLATRYWYLMAIGGVIIAFIGPVSIWKTITGKGWTWKGRHLQ